MTAKFKVLPKTCDLLEFATFSWWDNKSGPRYRYVWCCHAKQGNVDIVDPPSDFQLRLLTQLTLKSEAVRDPNCCDIDCNVYNLPEVGISGHEKDLMSVSYMFSGRCKSKVGRTIYSLNLVMALQHQQWVNRWRDILDAVVKRRLMLFRILLHKVCQFFLMWRLHAARLDTCFCHQLWLSMEYHKRTSINTSPYALPLTFLTRYPKSVMRLNTWSLTATRGSQVMLTKPCQWWHRMSGFEHCVFCEYMEVIWVWRVLSVAADDLVTSCVGSTHGWFKSG